jgi:D-alanyl-D-alanine carboxypeptidase
MALARPMQPFFVNMRIIHKCYNFRNTNSGLGQLTMIQSTAWLDGYGRVIESSGDPLPIYSITKTFIAAAILALKIDLQAPISGWIDPAICPRANNITVEHLLTHTSGLRDYGNNPAYIEAVKTRQPAWADETFAEHTLRQPLLFEPGAGWSYSNPNFWLLSQIAQRQSGLDFEGVIRQQIILPLRLAQTRVANGIFSSRLPEYPAGWVWHGLLIASAEDVARFMASGLVTPLGRHLVKVPGVQPLWDAPHYGYGLMVEPGVRLGHNGGGPGYTASCFKFIAPDVTGCVLTESEPEGDDAFIQLLALAKRKMEESHGHR